MAKNEKYNEEDGVWRTVGGRRIFIKNGQSLSDAMKESGKFKKAKKKEKLTDSDEDKEIKGRMKELQREIDSGRNNKEKTERLKEELQQYKDKYEVDNEKEFHFAGEELYSDDPNRFGDKLRQYNEKMAKEQDAKNREENKKDHTFKMNDEEKNEVGDKQESRTLRNFDNMSQEELDDIARSEMSDKEYKDYEKTKPNDDVEKEILDRFGEDYGYDADKSNIDNLKSQIDYMRNPNESINRTAQRLVEGGDFLIYNEDVKDWLDKHNIKYNDDNFFDKYKQEMADKIEKLYNSKTQTGELKDDDIVNDDRKGFDYSFRTNKRDMFQVRYNRTGSNKNMDFATSASTFNRNRTDYDRVGQAQKDILKEGTKAREFFDKWDKKHLNSLTKKEYDELANDIEGLKKEYAYIEGSNFADQVKLDREYKPTPKSTNETINNSLRQKAYKKYLKEHPGSKMSFEDFKDMRKQ